MKTILFSLFAVLIGLGFYTNIAQAGGEWELSLGGSAVIGTPGDDPSMTVGPDDGVVRASLGYVAHPRVVVGLAMTQISLEEQVFGVFAKGYNTADSSSVKAFAKLGLNGLSTQGNSNFAVGASVGVQWALPMIKNVSLAGEVTNITEFQNEDLTSAQLAGLELVWKWD